MKELKAVLREVVEEVLQENGILSEDILKKKSEPRSRKRKEKTKKMDKTVGADRCVPPHA